MSKKRLCLDDSALASQSANVYKMPLCRLLYLSSAASQMQLEGKDMFVCLRFTTVAQLTGRVMCFLPSCQICSSWQLLLHCFSCKVVHRFWHNRKSIRPGDDVCLLD